jgi:hypothetical protein
MHNNPVTRSPPGHHRERHGLHTGVRHAQKAQAALHFHAAGGRRHGVWSKASESNASSATEICFCRWHAHHGPCRKKNTQGRSPGQKAAFAALRRTLFRRAIQAAALHRMACLSMSSSATSPPVSFDTCGISGSGTPSSRHKDTAVFDRLNCSASHAALPLFSGLSSQA